MDGGGFGNEIFVAFLLGVFHTSKRMRGFLVVFHTFLSLKGIVFERAILLM